MGALSRRQREEIPAEDADPRDTAGLAQAKPKAKGACVRDQALAELQDMLCAQDHWAVLSSSDVDAAGRTARSNTSCRA